ncbi:hypothetical protein BSLA_02r2423 [Burkholderia stabilis]|nr:hypothetical protein BSLA_02r2423 [Burkholderia stabilis]
MRHLPDPCKPSGQAGFIGLFIRCPILIGADFTGLYRNSAVRANISSSSSDTDVI